MRAPAAVPPQTDALRRAYFTAFSSRYPALSLRWGNTFSRWRDVPGTELVLAYYITNHSVGVFVRGQRGIPVTDTAANLPAFSLETRLGLPIGDPRVPFCQNYRFDPAIKTGWPKSHAFLHGTGSRTLEALAEIVGGLDTSATID
ncbi:MAG: hypothetical protein ABL879_09280 [Devosia sp.]